MKDCASTKRTKAPTTGNQIPGPDKISSLGMARGSILEDHERQWCGGCGEIMPRVNAVDVAFAVGLAALVVWIDTTEWKAATGRPIQTIKANARSTDSDGEVPILIVTEGFWQCSRSRL